MFKVSDLALSHVLHVSSFAHRYCYDDPSSYPSGYKYKIILADETIQQCQGPALAVFWSTLRSSRRRLQVLKGFEDVHSCSNPD